MRIKLLDKGNLRVKKWAYGKSSESYEKRSSLFIIEIKVGNS